MDVGIVVLGCDKNTVDAEHFAGVLSRRLPRGSAVFLVDGWQPPPSMPDALVIFTCAFIRDAQVESVTCILNWLTENEDQGWPSRICVAGCLAQRFGSELADALPDVDVIVGIGRTDDLVRLICKNQPAPDEPLVDAMPETSIRRLALRKRLSDLPYSFLKIADGCDHACAFCAIPMIKGRFESVPQGPLLDEARMLVESGAREINLVAQDITAYGQDLKGRYRLPNLLADLCDIPGDFWIRCLYCYPGGIDDALIEQIAAQPKIVPYLDIPLQHVDPEVLKAMRRPAADLDPAALVARLREAIPGLALRTTMMVGFPGETRAAHQRMLDAVETLRFEWLGVFLYSAEEGAEAAELPRKARSNTATARYNRVMEAQVEVTGAFNQARKGTRTRVLAQEYDETFGRWIARSGTEAPEVDGQILLDPDERLRPGMFVEAELYEAELYDMRGRAVLREP